MSPLCSVRYSSPCLHCLSFHPSLNANDGTAKDTARDYYREAGVSLRRPIVDVLRRAASRCDFIVGGVSDAGEE